jgi:hypothetical protein
MRCDFCGQTLKYREQVVYTFKREGELRAGYMIEGTDDDPYEGKYHGGCYGLLREQEPAFPEVGK